MNENQGNYALICQKQKRNFRGCKIPLKAIFSDLDFFSPRYRALSHKHGEKLHVYISEMKRYQVCWQEEIRITDGIYVGMLQDSLLKQISQNTGISWSL